MKENIKQKNKKGKPKTDRKPRATETEKTKKKVNQTGIFQKVPKTKK
jgi:hypothetical protein